MNQKLITKKLLKLVNAVSPTHLTLKDIMKDHDIDGEVSFSNRMELGGFISQGGIIPKNKYYSIREATQRNASQSSQ
jgi:hypothetical protein